MEWIEVFVSASQEGLEAAAGVLYQCGLTGLMIHDETDFAEFLENPNREWDYIADELVEEKENTKGLVTDISHQLKTPVAAVELSYELLQDASLDRKPA